jgi:hypothetical protein
MRSKIASRAGGHALERRFLELDNIQLMLLYRNAAREERVEKEEKAELIQVLHEKWVENFQIWFEGQQMYSNPGLFQKMRELKDLVAHRAEVSVEEFPILWENLMQTIPKEIIAEEPRTTPIDFLPESNDPELEKLFAGWVPRGLKNEQG